MLTFTTLTLKNFLSYGAVPTIVQLDRPGTTLILGEDLDNTASGIGANGVGKTVIINALVYALYDKPISNISKDNLVNNINKKNMTVTLDFTNGKHQYRIVRARKTKVGAPGNWSQLFCDGVDITPDSSGHTNAKIEEIIGIPFDLFVRIVAVSATHTPFLDLPVRHPTAANQTDIIEELFDLKALSEKAKRLSLDIKATELSLEMQSVRVDSLQREHDRHSKQLEAAEKRVMNWHTTNAAAIAEIESKLLRARTVDIDAQRSLINYRDSIAASISELTNQKQEYTRKLKEAAKNYSIANNELSHLKDEECPYCHQQLTEAHDKIESCTAAIADLTLKVDKYSELQKQVISDLEISQAELDAVSAQITVTDVDALFEIKNKAATYQKEIENLKAANNPFIEPMQELHDIKLDPIDMDTINELTNTITHQKFLLKLLTKKDSFVRKALLNKNIPFLNSRLSTYLVDLGLPHTVEFTHEMTASISQFGRLMDFGNLSNGQRARVNIALSFAFRDVLQSIYGRINVCMLDEILDVGLDAIGVQSAARMIKRKARDEKLSLYIISHRDEIDSAFDSRITVQMSKGFSFIKDED